MGILDFDSLRNRWVDIHTGRHEVDVSDAAYQEVLHNRKLSVDSHRDRLGNFVDEVFWDAPLKSNHGLLLTYSRLHDMAIAWATPGTSLYKSSTLLGELLSGLRVANRIGYNPGVSEFGNWWTWEVGIPTRLTSTLIAIYAYLSQEDIENNCAALDFYVPDPRFFMPEDRGRKLSTGTGRVNLCRAVLIRSLIDSNEAKFEQARRALPRSWKTVSSGDGFYADGSYITHGTVAYTGSYGIVVPHVLADIFALLDFAKRPAEGAVEFFELVGRSFLPIVYRGQVIDSVRGRSITRAGLRSKNEAVTLLRALVAMSPAADAATVSIWMGRCKAWLSDLEERFPNDSVNTVNAFRKVQSHPAPELGEPSGVNLFSAMDRMVVRQPGWALAISGASKRIAFYEPGNNENPRGFYTGAGMTSLYNSDIDHYDDDYWPTIDWYHLPGTTSDQKIIPDEAGGAFGRATCEGEWTGGNAVNVDSVDSAAVFAQHVVGLADTGLQARKFWLVHGGLVVALGAGICSTSGHLVETTIENRNLHADGENSLFIDGVENVQSMDAEKELYDSRWAHLENVGGYLLSPRTRLIAARKTRTGSWSDINLEGPQEAISRRYLSLSIQHGAFPRDGSYAYAMLPGATPLETERESARRRFEVLSNDAYVQAASIDGSVHGYAFWRPGSKAGITADGPCSVLVQEVDKVLSLAISPQGRDEVLSLLVDTGAGVEIVETVGGSASHVAADTRGLYPIPSRIKIVADRSGSDFEVLVTLRRLE